MMTDRVYFVVDGRWNSDPDECAVLYSSDDIESPMKFRDKDTPDGLVLSFKMTDGPLDLSRGKVEVDSLGNRLTQEAKQANLDE